MILIKGCNYDLIEEIISKTGSFTIVDITEIESINENQIICNIEIDEKRILVCFHENDLVLVRQDVIDQRIIHIESRRFREVVIS